MAKKTLDDRTIKAAKPKAKTYQLMERDGFGLRVEPSGAKSFILFKRFGGNTNPVRRQLGTYPAMSLAEAHKKAAAWRELIAKGVDPATEARRVQQAAIEAERAKQKAIFGAAFEVYERRKLARLRTGVTIAKEMRREFGPKGADWFDTPLADIDRSMIKAVILAISDRGHKAQAHQIFGYLRAFWNWVCDNDDVYGIEDSPCLKLKPIKLIGPRARGDRRLNDAELAAIWRASEVMGGPEGSFVKLLLLSGVRRNEAARMQWRELDLKDGVLVIDAKRMKNGEAHLVSLVPDLRAVIDALPPRGKGGDYALTNTGGLSPVSDFSRLKTRLDALVKADLEAQGLEFKSFVLHDIRRAVRTQLSKLRVSGEVCEAVLAHAKPGLNKTYNLHEYQDEKAEALQLWHEKLRTIVEPDPEPGSNVVKFPHAA